MASTAAWSAAFSLPRPRRRAAAIAAASVTRATSSTRTRSSPFKRSLRHVASVLLMQQRSAKPPCARSLKLFDPDHLRPRRNLAVRLDRIECLANILFRRLMRDQSTHRLRRRIRHVAAASAARCFPAKRRDRPCAWRSLPWRPAGRARTGECNRTRRAAERFARLNGFKLRHRLAETAAARARARHRRCRWPPPMPSALTPAPGPTSSTEPEKSPSIATQLVTPDTCAMAASSAPTRDARAARCPVGVRSATPEQLDPVAETRRQPRYRQR